MKTWCTFSVLHLNNLLKKQLVGICFRKTFKNSYGMPIYRVINKCYKLHFTGKVLLWPSTASSRTHACQIKRWRFKAQPHFG